MSWNYRVIRQDYGERYDEEDRYGFEIHEVYYNDNGEIDGWTDQRMEPYGSMLGELRGDLDLMVKALDKPILEKVIVEGEEKLAEVEEKCPM